LNSGIRDVGSSASLTSDALDPTSRMPEFKTCPVAVEKAAFTPDEHNGAVVGPAVART